MTSRNSTTKIFEALKQEITSGVYPPLAPLNEVKLASLYGTSRNTVKKVLLMLEKENLVSIELNKGAKVKSVSIDEVREFLDIRVILERFVVGKTVPVIPGEDIETMEELLEAMKQNIQKNDLVEYSKNNMVFHNIIYTACPNRAAVEITTSLKVQLRRYNSKTILVPGRGASSLEEHSAILRAFRKRDVGNAELLIEQHILNVKKTFEDNLSLLF